MEKTHTHTVRVVEKRRVQLGREVTSETTKLEDVVVYDAATKAEARKVVRQAYPDAARWRIGRVWEVRAHG